MSAAAEAVARECTHPKVRGSRRALLITIAKLIPEGDTKTAPISIEELMASSGYYDQSVRKARDVLVAIGALRVVGGGRGRAASYELLALPGAGADPSLPLIGVVRSARPAAVSTAPALFDPVDVEVDATSSAAAVIEGPAKKVGEKYRTRLAHLGEKYRTWRAGAETKVGEKYRPLWMIVNVGDLYRTLVTNIGEKYRTVLKKFGTFHRPLPQVVDVDDARARDVRTHFKNVHTPAPPAVEPSPPRIACRWHGTVHAWCDGRVHVPVALHREFLRKHARVDGERDADVEAKLFAFYAAANAGLAPDDVISEDDFRFWRRIYGAAFRGVPSHDQRAAPRGGPISGASGCPHQPTCDRTLECIDRIIAEGRAASARQRRG